MLEEGDTVTQEIETEHFGEGHIDTITETTAIIKLLVHAAKFIARVI